MNSNRRGTDRPIQMAHDDKSSCAVFDENYRFILSLFHFTHELGELMSASTHAGSCLFKGVSHFVMQRQHSLQYIRMKMICHSKFIITICVWCVGTLVHNSLRVTLSPSLTKVLLHEGKTSRVGCFLSSYVTRLGCRLSVSKLLFRAANIVTKFRRHTAPAAAHFFNVAVLHRAHGSVSNYYVHRKF